MKLPRLLAAAALRLMARGHRSDAGRPLQTGALPWRRTAQGALEILLVTGRGSQRWLVPKGWPMRGKSLAGAAAQEALEEAGVEGEIGNRPIGEFDHEKRHPILGFIEVTIRLYPLEVRCELADWPEREQRTRGWFTPEEAAAKTRSAALASLIAGFAASQSKACPAATDAEPTPASASGEGSLFTSLVQDQNAIRPLVGSPSREPACPT